MSDLQHRPDDMIHVRLPAELRAAVERVAQEENRTLSGQVRHIIARAVMTEAATTGQQQPAAA
jgi:CopG-like RHH_1 or ribbon-helix-helix domain, RHH_5